MQPSTARDLGERAAIEIIRSYPLPQTAGAVLLSDDRDAERLVVVDPDKLVLLTTWDYLRQLEEPQRIQSADAVIEAVRAAGRNPPQRDLWSRHDSEIPRCRRLHTSAPPSRCGGARLLDAG